MWTIAPDPCSIMPGRTTRSSRTADSRFALRARIQSSSVNPSAPPGPEKDAPTQCTTISRPPSISAAWQATRTAPSGDARSASMTGTGEPLTPCRPATTTRALCAVSSAATASPMPRVPPVTSARLPSRPTGPGPSPKAAARGRPSAAELSAIDAPIRDSPSLSARRKHQASPRGRVKRARKPVRPDRPEVTAVRLPVSPRTPNGSLVAELLLLVDGSRRAA